LQSNLEYLKLLLPHLKDKQFFHQLYNHHLEFDSNTYYHQDLYLYLALQALK
jgi:hypothetical protein